MNVRKSWRARGLQALQVRFDYLMGRQQSALMFWVTSSDGPDVKEFLLEKRIYHKAGRAVPGYGTRYWVPERQTGAVLLMLRYTPPLHFHRLNSAR